jgi:hypothetical protein
MLLIRARTPKLKREKRKQKSSSFCQQNVLIREDRCAQTSYTGVTVLV